MMGSLPFQIFDKKNGEQLHSLLHFCPLFRGQIPGEVSIELGTV